MDVVALTTSTRLERLFNTKKSGESSNQTINVKNVGKQKMILHLHKRANNGYDTNNDAYLPYAENDFSDVRIKTQSEKMLPYHVVYRGNIDIIPDARIGLDQYGLIFTDSSKNMVQAHNGVLSYSADNGITWTQYTNLNLADAHVVFVDSHDNIYFCKHGITGSGILYRSAPPYSSYAQVLDITSGYTGCSILSYAMVEHPDGELFVGAYQNENAIRVYKSTNNGVNWSSVLSVLGTYQHVHSMMIDTNVTPPALYVGADGGGGVYKTTDKGSNWTDLRAVHTTMPQATDFGVIYAANGYRLLGGETAIVGGYSLVKTTDDSTFTAIPMSGNSIYRVKDLNGKLFASCAGVNRYKNASVFVSEDNGDTWVEAYTTEPLQVVSASDGYRYMSKDTYASTNYEQIIVGCQNTLASPLRIISNENTYYAEVIVEVPDGCTSLTVESGYFCPDETQIYNTFEIPNRKIIYLALNEGGNTLTESVSGTTLSGTFSYGTIGKHLSYHYPYITNPDESKSILLSSLTAGLELPISLSGLSAFTISFWGRFNSATTRFNIIGRPTTTGNDTLRFSGGYQLQKGEGTAIVSLKFPKVLGVFSKYDIVVDVANGNIKTYENGQYGFTSSLDIASLLANITSLTTVNLLKAVTYNADDVIQHFNIYEGALSESDMYNSYNDYISDNYRVLS